MSPEELMKTLDESARAVAALTGVRQQFIDAGWTPEHAEEAVLIMLRGASGGAA